MLAHKFHTSGGSKISCTFLVRYSTTAAAAQTQTNIFQDYLINSFGFSKQEAHSAAKKVNRSRPLRNDPDLVIDYLLKLGLSKIQIKSIVSTMPKLLSCNVDKTLKPKVKVFEDLGLQGSELVKIIAVFKTLLRRGLDSEIKPTIDNLRKVLGSDDKVADALRKRPFLLRNFANKRLVANVSVLQKNGFSHENVVKFILENPMPISVKCPERIQEVLDLVENEFGIPRESKMFYYGFELLCKLNKPTIDKKLGVFRSFGWSDVILYSMVRKLPGTIDISEAKLKNCLNFFMGELGYRAEYLASHPVLFCMSLENRVKPRHEVLKILNEKKLNKKKAALYAVLCLRESKFVENYLSPYKDKIPELYQSYIMSLGTPAIEKP